MIRFTESSRVQRLKSIISSYLAEAMRYAEEAIQPKRESKAIELPEGLVEAMNCDQELADAFARLTPGRQRNYVTNLNSAKKHETKVARIGKFRDKIISGKGGMQR